MNRNIKAWFISGVIAVIALVVNFFIFAYSYNSLTSTLLTEDQRIENANFIMSTTLPLFAFSSILIWCSVGYLLNKTYRRTARENKHNPQN